MAVQIGFWDIERRLAELSAEGDPLETLSKTVDFEVFRPILERAVRRRSAPSKGGRPGFDVVLKFKMLVLQALHGLALGRTAYLVRDRLSWMRFCSLGPGDAVPDANTLWDFREEFSTSGNMASKQVVDFEQNKNDDDRITATDVSAYPLKHWFSYANPYRLG